MLIYIKVTTLFNILRWKKAGEDLISQFWGCDNIYLMRWQGFLQTKGEAKWMGPLLEALIVGGLIAHKATQPLPATLSSQQIQQLLV